MFRDVVHPLFREVFVQPKVNQVPADPARIDAVLATAMPEAFGYLESMAGNDFLAGPALSMGDVAVVSNLINFQYIGFELDAHRYPRLTALFERVILTPSMRKAVQQEQPVVQSMDLDNRCVQRALA